MGFSMTIEGKYRIKGEKTDKNFSIPNRYIDTLDLSIDGDGRNEIANAIFRVAVSGKIHPGAENGNLFLFGAVLTPLMKETEYIGPLIITVSTQGHIYRQITFKSCVDLNYDESYSVENGCGSWSLSLQNKKDLNDSIKYI